MTRIIRITQVDPLKDFEGIERALNDGLALRIRMKDDGRHAHMQQLIHWHLPTEAVLGAVKDDKFHFEYAGRDFLPSMALVTVSNAYLKNGHNLIHTEKPRLPAEGVLGTILREEYRVTARKLDELEGNVALEVVKRGYGLRSFEHSKDHGLIVPLIGKSFAEVYFALQRGIYQLREEKK